MPNWGMLGDYGCMGLGGFLVCELLIAYLVKFVFFK